MLHFSCIFKNQPAVFLFVFFPVNFDASWETLFTSGSLIEPIELYQEVLLFISLLQNEQ